MSTTPTPSTPTTGDAGPASRIPDDIDVPTYVVRTVVAVAFAYIGARTAMAIAAGAPLRWWWIPIEVAITVILVGLSIVVVCAIPIRRDLDAILGRAAGNEKQLREQNRSQTFLRDVQHAFEMIEQEDELFGTAALALQAAGPANAEILVADASNAHVSRRVIAEGRAAPGCGVTTPHHCPAVRQGHTLRFDDPNGLASCPRLRERGLAAGSRAACIPINILGSPAAVLHAACDCDVDADEVEFGVRALEGVAVRFGQRLGMMRAMAQSQLQADTDPLTGLLNRRAMENRVRELQREGVPFAVAMADLDHFKALNDTYGHDTGDRALRLFSRVARAAVRDSDIVCRHGGEEFVIILVGANVVDAAPVLHRLREHLAEALTDAELPAYTASIGLADSTISRDLHELLVAADRALLDAKATGRDRLVIGDDRFLAPDPT